MNNELRIVNYCIEQIKNRPLSGYFVGGNWSKKFKINDKLTVVVDGFSIDLNWQRGSSITFDLGTTQFCVGAKRHGDRIQQKVWRLHVLLQKCETLYWIEEQKKREEKHNQELNSFVNDFENTSFEVI